MQKQFERCYSEIAFLAIRIITWKLTFKLGWQKHLENKLGMIE